MKCGGVTLVAVLQLPQRARVLPLADASERMSVLAVAAIVVWLVAGVWALGAGW